MTNLAKQWEKIISNNSKTKETGSFDDSTKVMNKILKEDNFILN